MAFPETDFAGWTRDDVLSFWKRYHAALAAYARRRLRGLDDDLVADLVSGFVTKQLEREADPELAPVFAAYQAAGGQWLPASFRGYLCTAFYRHCRDELRKRRPTLPLLDDEPTREAFDAFARIEARDLLERIRERVLARVHAVLDDADALARHQAFYAAKWPADLSAPCPPDAEVARQLGLEPKAARVIKERLQDRIVWVLTSEVARGGVTLAEANACLAAFFRVAARLDEVA